MDKVRLKTLIKRTLRHYITVMTFGVLVGFTIVTLLWPHAEYYLTDQEIDQADISALSTTQVALGRSLPTRLRIPRMNLDTTFVDPLGLNIDQSVSVPDSYTEVGWYSGGVSPGEVGPAVVLGHVDSYTGPAVFFSLGQLKIGDEVFVDRQDGTTATFEVTEMRRYPQDQFPSERVYGAVDYPALRLVTCTGIYDRGVQRYSHNLVVYATLKDSDRVTSTTDTQD